MRLETEEYMTIGRVNGVRERAGNLRRQFLKYKDAKIVYSLTHRKLLEMADEAGALYQIGRKTKGKYCQLIQIDIV